ncbi:MAG TPA: hypothetical protein VFU23_05280 [Gemmatimonadales bacterium]|nr:hypothetical protein [Gemmatimonadales bacterium]
MVRALIRILGWLLTPLVAWIAAFVGAWIGSMLGSGFNNSMTTLWVMVGCGAVAALAGAWAWLRYLRKHPRLQKTLAVAADGTPLIALDQQPPPSGQ